MSDIYINASDKKLSHSKKTSPAFQVFMKVLWAWEASLTFGKKISVAQDEHIGKGERVGKANLVKLPSAFPHGPGHKHKPSIQNIVEAVTFPSCHETSRCSLSFTEQSSLALCKCTNQVQRHCLCAHLCKPLRNSPQQAFSRVVCPLKRPLVPEMDAHCYGRGTALLQKHFRH